MKKRFLMLGVALGALLVGQDTGDRVTVPFRDPAKPRTLNVELINGGVTVRGYDGKDAIIEANPRNGERRNRIRSRDVPPGMHRIDNGSGGLDIVEDNNVIRVKGGISGSVDVVIQVPNQTSLNLKTLNGGKILVENIAGEIEAENLNGAIEITNASGAVVARRFVRNSEMTGSSEWRHHRMAASSKER